MELVSRNEYYKRIRETGRLPKDNEVEIMPLDLAAYPLNDTTKRIADINFSEETTDRDGNYMLLGHWWSDLSYQFAQKCKFDLVQDNCYSSYAYSDEQLAIFTYCEGDITLILFTDRESYEKSKKETIKFYQEVVK